MLQSHCNFEISWPMKTSVTYLQFYDYPLLFVEISWLVFKRNGSKFIAEAE